MDKLLEALREADKARAITIARQLVYLANNSDEREPITQRRDDLVWLLSHIEAR